jgi:hypothetical protein
MQTLKLNFPRFLLVVLMSTASLCLAETNVDSLSSIGAQVEQHAVIRSAFTQTKQMAALKRPLITHGQLIYSRNNGVLWQIEQPYRMSYLLSENKIVEINAQGLRKERNVRDIPGLVQVGKVFRAMLGANIEELKNTFDVSIDGNANKWEVQLTPKQVQLKQFLNSLNLKGGQFIESIKISEVGGDNTLIQLHHTNSSVTLDERELELFTDKHSPQ